ncbi:MAG: hypothetical protein CVT92_04385 [Bacteroidetes bacterium HGW-Bacteroidetes-1]|jgi:Tol biopolymer transport system component|nr:MAG: hypothetical protein CVT92_04385 [Bacteroidetes bacterium HGW-Bacteroidetes-1]
MRSLLVLCIVIVFSHLSARGQIITEYVCNKITSGAFFDDNPVFSPDGKTILFDSNRKGIRQLFLLQIHGSLLIQETDNEYPVIIPSFHPDGKTIVASCHEGYRYSVFDSDGSKKLFQLKKRKVEIQSPSYNPSANLLLFKGKTSNDKHWKVMTYDFRYDNLNEVFKTEIDIENPRWSPKGMYISFDLKKNEYENDSKIGITHWNGSPYEIISSDTMKVSQATWGNLMGKIACVGNNEKGYWLLIARIEDNSFVPLIFSTQPILNPDWSSDGQSIVFALNESEFKQNLWILNLRD